MLSLQMSVHMIPIIPQKSILTEEALREIRQYVPAHFCPVDRAGITQEIALKLPLFWDSLIAGEVMRVKEFVRQHKSKSIKIHRTHLSEEIQTRFPKFWRALVEGEAREADYIIRKYASRAE